MGRRKKIIDEIEVGEGVQKDLIMRRKQKKLCEGSKVCEDGSVARTLFAPNWRKYGLLQEILGVVRVKRIQ